MAGYLAHDMRGMTAITRRTIAGEGSNDKTIEYYGAVNAVGANVLYIREWDVHVQWKVRKPSGLTRYVGICRAAALEYERADMVGANIWLSDPCLALDRDGNAVELYRVGTGDGASIGQSAVKLGTLPAIGYARSTDSWMAVSNGELLHFDCPTAEYGLARYEMAARAIQRAGDLHGILVDAIDKQRVLGISDPLQGVVSYAIPIEISVTLVPDEHWEAMQNILRKRLAPGYSPGGTQGNRDGERAA